MMHEPRELFIVKYTLLVALYEYVESGINELLRGRGR